MNTGGVVIISLLCVSTIFEDFASGECDKVTAVVGTALNLSVMPDFSGCERKWLEDGNAISVNCSLNSCTVISNVSSASVGGKMFSMTCNDTSDCWIIAYVKPYDQKIIFDPKYYKEGEQIIVTCTAETYPANRSENFTLFHPAHKEVQSSIRYIQNGIQYTIESADICDKGIYMCHVYLTTGIYTDEMEDLTKECTEETAEIGKPIILSARHPSCTCKKTWFDDGNVIPECDEKNSCTVISNVSSASVGGKMFNFTCNDTSDCWIIAYDLAPDNTETTPRNSEGSATQSASLYVVSLVTFASLSVVHSSY